MKLVLRVLAVVLLMTIATLKLARGDDSNGWIAFTSGAFRSPELFLVASDGDELRRMAPWRNCPENLRWSRDGQWIGFANGCYTGNDAWSPDGSRLVVARGQSSLYIVDAGGERLLASNAIEPQWSPDGDWIYARKNHPDGSSFERIHTKTGRVESLLPARAVFTTPNLSPDGNFLVLAMPTETGNELFLMSSDGRTLTPIAMDLPAPRLLSPRWSPDGTWIAFLGGGQLSHHIYRIRPDGSDLARLSRQDGNVGYLQWSPDGAWLLFTANYTGERDIYRMRADGSHLQNLTAGLGRDHAPHYAPDFNRQWHPFWLMVAAVGLIFLSLMGRLHR